MIFGSCHKSMRQMGPEGLVRSTSDGFWLVMFVGALALVGWEANLYYFSPDATVQVIDSCDADATKVHALEISKWKSKITPRPPPNLSKLRDRGCV
jgi:hypothetical protein